MLRSLAILLAFCAVSIPPALSDSRDDFRIARISLVEGNASFQHQGDTDWAAVTINLSLQAGDRIYTGRSGRLEVEFDDGSVLRLAEDTDVELLSLGENLIQMRQSLGLSTLTLRSSIEYEVATPAASFTAVRKGVYRFDVVDNGDSDGIVRKGMLEATNGRFNTRAESGELVHVTAGDSAKYLVSRYERRDDWDNWNDRRNAELNAYESRRYIPDYVYVGVRDLDAHGRWCDVDGYGSAWVPGGIDAGWSPYSVGRGMYRPYWGWTWVSYEPWGWLPYHYGRWHHSVRFGWCWLPGPSFGFHFWSPGLVRFHRGPNWVRWTALGPGDYYNVNNYFYRNTYNYHLNGMRMLQRRSPDDLENRHVPGAVRTASTDSFVSESFGPRGRGGSFNTNERGRMVTEGLDIQPTRRSFQPDPDRTPVAPRSTVVMPSLVRSTPSVGGSNDRYRVISTDAGRTAFGSSRGRSAGSGESVSPGEGRASRSGESTPDLTIPKDGRGSASGIWNRNSTVGAGEGGLRNRDRDTPAGRQTDGSGSSSGRDSSSRRIETPSRTYSTPGFENSRSRGRESQGGFPSRIEDPSSGSRQPAGPSTPSRVEPSNRTPAERPKPESRRPGSEDSSANYSSPGASYMDRSSGSQAYQARSYSGVDRGRSHGSDSTSSFSGSRGSESRSVPEAAPSRSYSYGSGAGDRGAYSAGRSYDGNSAFGGSRSRSFAGSSPSYGSRMDSPSGSTRSYGGSSFGRSAAPSQSYGSGRSFGGVQGGRSSSQAPSSNSSRSGGSSRGRRN